MYFMIISVIGKIQREVREWPICSLFKMENFVDLFHTSWSLLQRTSLENFFNLQIFIRITQFSTSITQQSEKNTDNNNKSLSILPIS